MVKKLKLLSLFSGIGGLDLGLERSGAFETVAQCEINDFCRLVLAKHWPDVRRYEDVRTLTADVVRRDGIAVDAICGGFPCQGISQAGLGAGLSDERSGLWFEFDRIVGEVRPRLVIVENSGRLPSRGLDQVLGCFAARGYDAEWRPIPARLVGAPHWRDRTWIVAYPQWSERRPEPYFRTIGRVGWLQQPMAWDRDWQDALTEFRGVDDGLPRSVASTDAYRNAVVPQIPELIGRAILQNMEEAA